MQEEGEKAFANKRVELQSMRSKQRSKAKEKEGHRRSTTTIIPLFSTTTPRHRENQPTNPTFSSHTSRAPHRRRETWPKGAPKPIPVRATSIELNDGL